MSCRTRRRSYVEISPWLLSLPEWRVLTSLSPRIFALGDGVPRRGAKNSADPIQAIANRQQPRGD